MEVYCTDTVETSGKQNNIFNLFPIMVPNSSPESPIAVVLQAAFLSFSVHRQHAHKYRVLFLSHKMQTLNTLFCLIFHLIVYMELIPHHYIFRCLLVCTLQMFLYIGKKTSKRFALTAYQSFRK